MIGMHQRMETEIRNIGMTSVVLAVMVKLRGCLKVAVVLL
jgi:hypothetical protein